MTIDTRYVQGQRVDTIRTGRRTLGHIVTDTTINGRARGGLRLVTDLSIEELCAAARSMTLKYGLLRLPQGGAKAGVIGDPEASLEQRRRVLAEFADASAPLLTSQAYVPDSDIGTRTEDIRWMMQSIGAPIASREWRAGRSGRHTARSVRAAAGAAMAHKGRTLDGATVAIEGFGRVGSALAELMVIHGARIVAVSTSFGALYRADGFTAAELNRLASSHFLEGYDGVERLDRAALLELPVDLLMPCARFRSIDPDNVGGVRSAVICGGANNPVHIEAEHILESRGVLCVPDFVANCGGVLGSTMDFAGVRADQTDTMIDRHLRQFVATLLDQADRRREPPRVVAEELALARFEQIQWAAEHPTLRDRLFALAVACHRRGLVPEVLTGTLARAYFERRLT